MIESIREKFSPWFDDISDSLLEKLKESYVELIYKKGEILCKQGGFANQIIFMESGLVKMYREYRDKILILKFAKAGEFIGLSSLYNESLFHYSASCLNDCKVYYIDINVIKLFIKENHKFAEKIIGNVNRNTSVYFERLVSLTQKQLHGQIADAVLHLSRDIYKADKFNMLLTRSDIAAFCGVSTESAIRTLKEMHNDKIIKIEGKNIEIKSYKLLDRLSQIG